MHDIYALNYYIFVVMNAYLHRCTQVPVHVSRQVKPGIYCTADFIYQDISYSDHKLTFVVQTLKTKLSLLKSLK